MNIFNNFEKWKRNRMYPIHIFNNDPYNRLYTSFVWNPKKGYFGFIAIENNKYK